MMTAPKILKILRYNTVPGYHVSMYVLRYSGDPVASGGDPRETRRHQLETPLTVKQANDAVPLAAVTIYADDKL
jgi:hypothetical protein